MVTNEGSTMRCLIAIGLVLVAHAQSHAQTAPNTWWVQFTDKASTPYSIDQPEPFLSERAIQRRQIQGIAVDELDLPVDPAYIQAVLALGNVQLHNRSKWFNAITIRTSDPGVLDAIAGLPFVLNIRSTRSEGTASGNPNKFAIEEQLAVREYDYGDSFNQISMMNGHLLHGLNAQGQGMLIGVLDSGFEGTDVIPGFDALRARGGIVYTSDQVDHDGDVYADHWHGRSVLSCMAAIVEGALVGTAPLADYVLVRTEDVATEYLVEEDNWVSGAELCDSLGVDILNTSLGYTTFDDSLQDHSYLDLDGATTRISIAAGIASSRGMIPVISAGNQGNSEWFHISAPADAMDVLAVGATGAQAQHAFFSSHGPSADGRVKPDVAAMGWGTTGIGPDGIDIQPINGTSFSAPLVSGLVACLWQMHPQRTAQDIMDAVRRSASQFNAPDIQLGHGIPDFMQAHQWLELTTPVPERTATMFSMYPHPFSDSFTLVLPQVQDGTLVLEMWDMTGRLVWSYHAAAGPDQFTVQDQGLSRLALGPYVLRMNGELVRTVIKAQ